ncbi:MAG: PAS domain S-box protein [Candidatus Marinimicrobia bacterium]|jgi:PAS domain S-box-containing protein|nr:PAS domain S-box protein [Candidatus Neomarinimicrobiota bacterium]MBT4360436.1 PAS domain S-box protein [Candidatus Neomarinimicrobiota bacterium]MBT4715509.1 PAS domain S-box protein [Candidatus Neomarinimicrobiota bacterium]MBT4947279.1 PAS domain S-box protein [Candidatus Neomarinimicrobiota bacterium]MBT5270729.1 PAS domain S-box protein [Candidatus Neomarinimicrobiota bacterium]
MIKAQYKIRILIVEDERLSAEDLSIRLTHNDFEVVGIAGTGAEALKLTADTKPDIILMDIKLRGKMNGIEAAQQIHQKHAVPVVFATAYGDEDHISKAIQDADAYGFLHKPIDHQAAHTMIRIALTRFATDQMMLRINELLGMKDSIYSGLDSTRSIAEIATLLHNSFSATNIFKKYWIVLWSDDGKIGASQKKGISDKVFATYLKKRDRKSLENQKMMIPDDLMNTILDEDTFLILIRGEDQVVGLFGFTWNLGIPNFRSEFAAIKDVAHLISQSIKNTQLKDEQEKTQKQVADSEAHIKAIVEQSTTGIYIIDNKSKFVYVNDRLCEIFDRPREELIGSNFSEHLGPSRLRVIQNYEARQAGEEAPGDYPLDILRPDGKMRDILVSANSFVDSEGNVKNVGHALDVTDQNLANLELKKLSQAVEQSPVMTLITDVEGNIQYVNGQFLSLMGYSLEELIGKNPRLYKSGQHDKSFYKELWDTIKSGTVWTGEIVNRKRSGELTWGKASISPIRNSYSIVTHFVALIEDITRQKKEEIRAQKDQKLKDVLYAITSAAIKARDVSSLYEKIYQYISEIISSSNFYLAMLNKDDNTIYFPYEIDSYDSKMPESIPCDPENSLTARTIVQQKTLHIKQAEIRELIENGQILIAGELPSVWLGIPLKVKEEVIGAFVLQEYDGLTQYDDEDVKLLDLAAGQVALTIDRARKAKALEELASELANANGMKELLLDVITHDLRNPAGVISAITELLSAEDSSNEMFEVLRGSADSLMKVIENATVLSKLSIGENITKEDLDLVPILREMETEFASQLSTASMTLTNNLPKSLIVQANPIISEIPKNYISNAIKYSSTGGTINVILRQVGGKVILCVEDSGEPIPHELRETIFERSVQLAEGKKQGRGLGLAIVKRIATAHDAIVGIEDSPQGGNSFFLKF